MFLLSAFLTNPRMSAIYPSLNLQTPDQMADQSRAKQTKVVIKTKCQFLVNSWILSMIVDGQRLATKLIVA